MENKWFDVKDKEGVWRIGYCLSVDERGIRNVRMDGFPPFMNTVCIFVHVVVLQSFWKHSTH